MYNKVYITYFDLLGFKKFIEKNDEEHIDTRMGHIFRCKHIRYHYILDNRFKH